MEPVVHANAQDLFDQLESIGLKPKIGPVLWATNRGGCSVHVLRGGKCPMSFCFLDTGELIDVETEDCVFEINEGANYPYKVRLEWYEAYQEIVKEFENHLYTTQDAMRIKSMRNDIGDIYSSAESDDPTAVAMDAYTWKKIQHFLYSIQFAEPSEMVKNRHPKDS